MTTYANPTFTLDYQGLCAQIADTLNRQDLAISIPNFVLLAGARIQRDMVRLKHPMAIKHATAVATETLFPLPPDYLGMQLLQDTDTTTPLVYITPDQAKEVTSGGWPLTGGPFPVVPPWTPAVWPQGWYYTIIGDHIRVFLPVPTTDNSVQLDLYYYAMLPALTADNTTNWVLTRYPDLYLYGALLHTAPYLKNDDRLATWAQMYKSVIDEIETEADRAVRSQTKLVAARRGF